MCPARKSNRAFQVTRAVSHGGPAVQVRKSNVHLMTIIWLWTSIGGHVTTPSMPTLLDDLRYGYQEALDDWRKWTKAGCSIVVLIEHACSVVRSTTQGAGDPGLNPAFNLVKHRSRDHPRFPGVGLRYQEVVYWAQRTKEKCRLVSASCNVGSLDRDSLSRGGRGLKLIKEYIHIYMRDGGKYFLIAVLFTRMRRIGWFNGGKKYLKRLKFITNLCEIFCRFI